MVKQSHRNRQPRSSIYWSP